MEQGELTASGYPYIVKRLVRGQPLTAAVEVYRGIPKDVSVGPASLFDGAGHRALILYRGVSFFETEYYGVGTSGVTKLALPLKSRPIAMVDGQLIVKLSEAWNDGATYIRTGSLASFDVARAAASPPHLSPVAVFEPGPRESVDGASATRDRLVATVYENVRGRAFVFTRAANGTWTRTALPLPDNLAVSIADVNLNGTEALLNVAGFLTPSSVWLADAHTASIAVAKTLRAQFDASRDTVDQRQATSKDGTKVPYFVVHPEGEARRSNPTVMTVRRIPRSPTLRLIPARSASSCSTRRRVRAGQHSRRRRVRSRLARSGGCDPSVGDLTTAVVAQDPISNKITSPRRLGITARTVDSHVASSRRSIRPLSGVDSRWVLDASLRARRGRILGG